MTGKITDVAGIAVGHVSDFEALTGCTALLFEAGAVAGVFVPGMASTTRGLDTLRLTHLNETIHGILLSGGSSFGLNATGGVMRYLEERGIGFDVRCTVVPLVPSAILFDLGLGDCSVRPGEQMGYLACTQATVSEVAEGSIGVGTGATVGNLYGLKRAMKGGVGTASVEGPYGPVGALAAVNAFGDIVDRRTGKILAGLRDKQDGTELIGTASQLKQGIAPRDFAFQNTTLGVVATEVNLSKAQASRIAMVANGALVKTISPHHATFDGDVIFAVSTGRRAEEADVNVLSLLAEAALAEAIERAVVKAQGLGGVPAYRDLFGKGKP